MEVYHEADTSQTAASAVPRDREPRVVAPSQILSPGFVSARHLPDGDYADQLHREYSNVPPLRKDDTVIPPASDIPAMLSHFRHPRQRTVSVGPQSEADAYEMMALRERKRRQSRSSPEPSTDNPVNPSAQANTSRLSYLGNANTTLANEKSPNGSSNLLTLADDQETTPFPELKDETLLPDTHIDDQDDQALFAKLQVPRVRYDVEVVTKLVVYAGESAVVAY